VPALVSVIIPAWNVAPFVQTAIRSVLPQTYEELEVLVVDDGSQDDTVSVVKGITAPHVRLICQDIQGRRRRGTAGWWKHVALSSSSWMPMIC